jgi:hypothetical protein
MRRKIREIKVEGNVAFVPLTLGYEAVIDADDAPLVMGFNWSARVDGENVYAHRTETVSSSSLQRRRVYLHRVIMGEPSGMQVDHIDCDGLNNRKENLRQATHQQNTHNARIAKHNTSGFKGVWRARNKWRAQIRDGGKKISLGCFDTPEEAHAAYRKASGDLHGSFGRVR